MSFEQFPNDIPDAEKASPGDSEVTPAEVSQALRDLEMTPEDTDTKTLDQGGAGETLTVSPADEGSANEVFAGSPDTVIASQGEVREIPTTPETAPTSPDLEGDAYADEEVRQAEKRFHEATEVERVRAELAELGKEEGANLEFGDKDPGPPREGGGDDGGGGGGGTRYERSSGQSFSHEKQTHYKTCEACKGTGRKWFVFTCQKCWGSGKIKSGESEKITTTVSS